MKLNDLLRNIDYKVINGKDSIEIQDIYWDSRRVTPNSLFICVKNKNVDRHNYAEAAVKNGATALLIEHEIFNIPINVTVIKVENSKSAMSVIANTFYGEASKKFNLIGITGTKGKTSVCLFISGILESIGRKVGIISTIGNRVGSAILQTKKLNPTTPDSIELQCSFAEMIDMNVTDTILEVTSIALEQHRVDMCDFDIGIFTNLTQNNLDQHGSMENYKQAKMKLFEKCRFGIVNADDAVSKDILENSYCDIVTYGINNNANFIAKDIKYSLQGSTFALDFCGTNKSVTLNVPGKFNVYNALAAISTCYFLGLPLHLIIDALGTITQIKGGFEVIPNTEE